MTFITELTKELAKYNLLTHDFYKAWDKGELALETLKIYAREYYGHVAAFPRYISAIHSKCDNIEHRQILLGNLIEEEQGEENHPELWLRFAEGIGAEIDEIEQEIEMYNASRVQDDVGLEKLNAKITKAEKAQKEAEKLKALKKDAKLEQEENLDNTVKKNKHQNILGLDEYQFIKEFTDKSISKIYKEKHESKNENWQNNSKEYSKELLDELTKKYQNHIGESRVRKRKSKFAYV